MDVKTQINKALDTGEVALGSNKTVDVLLYGRPKMVLVAGNCPKVQRESIIYYAGLAKVPCVTLKETSSEIGSGCGRPHPVSALAVMDEGESAILEARE